MKKILLLTIILFNTAIYSQTFNGYLGSQSLNWATEQKDFSSLPRVGIAPMSIKLWDNYEGANAPSQWGTLLEINGRELHLDSQLYFTGSWDNSRIQYRSAFYGQSAWSSWSTMLDSKNDVESAGNLKITGNTNSYILNGNVGIGTTTPNAKLTVAGNFQSIVPPSSTPIDAITVDVQSFGTIANSVASSYFKVRDIGSGSIPFIIRGDGRVGVGTVNPDEMLTVKGKIHAEEIIVTANVTPDYVFQKYYTGKSVLKSDYIMPTLAEVAQFTKANNHLPNIPSAKEIQQNGMSLGEMNNLLLQKVEELTLYAIEQQNKADEQKKIMEAQSKLLEILAARLTNLENK